MTEEIHNQVKEIKQSFRFRMNGVASQSMREKGISYKINWGIPLPELKDMASKYGKNYDLAIELWKEDIRECQIMATFIMPSDNLDEDLVEVLMERVRTQEIAEVITHNLLRHLPFARPLAFRWLAGNNTLLQVCGYNLLSRLFADGQELGERLSNEFLDQAEVALQSPDMAVKHSAYNSVMRFCNLGSKQEAAAKQALKHLSLF